jgi:hypothetical protein
MRPEESGRVHAESVRYALQAAFRRNLNLPALLVPVDASKQRNAAEVIEEIRRHREGRKLRSVSIRRLIEEGCRY